MKILLAVDGSEYTRHMLDYIASHASSLGGNGEYVAVHVVPPVSQRAAAFFGTDVARNYYDEEAKEVLGTIRSLLEQRGIQASYQHRVGQPAAEIARLAESGSFDMVVMGSHGHNALKNLVLGSVATQVLAACKVPVLIVR